MVPPGLKLSMLVVSCGNAKHVLASLTRFIKEKKKKLLAFGRPLGERHSLIMFTCYCDNTVRLLLNYRIPRLLQGKYVC